LGTGETWTDFRGTRLTIGGIVKDLLLLAVLQGALLAQSIEGTWQGTLTLPNQNQGIRLAFKIAKNGNAYEGRFYNLENGRQFNLGAITLQGNAVKIVIPGNGMNYEGKIEGDGNSITGTLIQGTNPLKLSLKRATADTAWELPPPPAALKGLPSGTKLEFEVASIKPSPEDPSPNTGFSVTATEMSTRSISLARLITFAYALHRSQVSGLPSWAETEGYEIIAKLPQGSDPTDPQLLAMLQNLLKSRFNFSSHTEKRELSVYAISIGKGGLAGIKMVKSDSSGLNMGSQGLGRVRFRGATMANLANQLQLRVFDRPVIDQSGLTERYDFTLDWRLNEFQFPNAPAPQRAAAVTAADALPDLFTAFQQQLGMKLETTKAFVDVLVIDQVSKPTEN
jgi:uncharacterized protein (TIGR03435 family)